jgi:hypothetical protein
MTDTLTSEIESLTLYEVLHMIVDKLNWFTEDERAAAHRAIDVADPEATNPVFESPAAPPVLNSTPAGTPAQGAQETIDQTGGVSVNASATSEVARPTTEAADQSSAGEPATSAPPTPAEAGLSDQTAAPQPTPTTEPPSGAGASA